MSVYENEIIYNSIVVGGVRSPGVVTLRGHKRSVAWDVKGGGAQDGASTTRKGKVPSRFTASFYLVDDPVLGVNELIEWTVFSIVLRSTFEQTAAKALDIYHPDLADNGIKSVVVEEVGGLEHDGKGGANVTVAFLEYAPPKPKPASKPSGSKTGSDPKKKPDPNAAAKAELAALLAEAQRP
jgi:hypothetical protein